jgi:hypothetical protein
VTNTEWNGIIKPIVYTRRWWIIAVFSYNCITQTLIWNTWGPIAQSAKEVFGWDDVTIGMIPNYSNISTLYKINEPLNSEDKQTINTFVIHEVAG